MQAFCCCGPRRRDRRDDDEDGEAAPSIPVFNPPGLIDVPPNTSQAHELSTIPLPTHAARQSSQISPGEGPPGLCQLVDRNNLDDDEDDDQDDASLSAKRSTKTLDAKRIQDELEAAESVDGGSSRSHWSTRYLSPLIDLGQPGGGPRDTIEFSVETNPGLHTSSASAQGSPMDTTRRQVSCPQLVSSDCEAASSPIERGDRSPEPAPSATTAPSPRRPSTAQSMKGQPAAGLGVNAPRMERVIGADNDFDIRHGSHAWDDQSALGIWLIAQGMRSRDTSLLRLGEGESDAAAECDVMHSPSQDFGGIDSVLDTPPSVSQDNSIATALRPYEGCPDAYRRQKANTDATGATPREADWAEPDKDPSTVKLMDSASASGINFAGRSRNNPSSNYPSAMPSFEPSPADSAANSLSLSPQDIENLELSPFHWQGEFSILRELGHSEGQSSYATAEDDTSNAENNYGILTNLPRSPRAAHSRASVTTSEAASAQKRETEHRTINRTLTDVASRKSSPAIRSRFKEDLRTTSAPAPVRTSIVTKIQSSLSRLSRC
ncbi:hypothetical protein JDV02_006005 [Purpureocillium takamizusanense]|uniref:Uncharacterized protein n=1 Tax=Purpureocillium takamizusanense TaxID=2060973 RepID=A0A9Q8QJC9_9HYPO|nr:uncharacterized protein JDV02_006005 [Purpureocillium takamizusanense]UNI19859.1 hypothetical protein JDV02_006005 [Purpureocillium takamizusanense]